MKKPLLEVIESDNDNIGNYYYTGEIITDRFKEEYYVYATRPGISTWEDLEGNEYEASGDPIPLFVSVEDENNCYDEIDL